jgi:hypothetical protein
MRIIRPISNIKLYSINNQGHIIGGSDIEIIGNAYNNFKLMIKEMRINKMKPMLNTQHAVSYKRKKTTKKDMFISQLNIIIIARKI